MSSKHLKQEKGLVLGLGLIACLVALLIAALSARSHPPAADGDGMGTILLGLYVMGIGGLFLASYYFAHKTFLFRALIWTCEHWSHPKGRGMALFYAALGLVIGGISVLSGLGLTG